MDELTAPQWKCTLHFFAGSEMIVEGVRGDDIADIEFVKKKLSLLVDDIHFRLEDEKKKHG